MGSKSHWSVSPELEAVARELRAAVPERSELELDGLKRRVIAQASSDPSAHGLRPKGIFMRRRDLITTLLTVGLMTSTFALATIFSGLPAPLERMGDAALAQYGNDGNDGNGNGGGGNNGGSEDPAPPALRPAPLPAQAVALGRAECRTFGQNFTGPGSGRAFGACVSAAAQILQNPAASPEAVCAARGLESRRRRGERRSDMSSCILAVFRSRDSFYLG